MTSYIKRAVFGAATTAAGLVARNFGPQLLSKGLQIGNLRNKIEDRTLNTLKEKASEILKNRTEEMPSQVVATIQAQVIAIPQSITKKAILEVLQQGAQAAKEAVLGTEPIDLQTIATEAKEYVLETAAMSFGVQIGDYELNITPVDICKVVVATAAVALIAYSFFSQAPSPTPVQQVVQPTPAAPKPRTAPQTEELDAAQMYAILAQARHPDARRMASPTARLMLLPGTDRT